MSSMPSTPQPGPTGPRDRGTSAGPLTVRHRPGTLFIDVLDDRGEAVAVVKTALLVNEPAALALAYRMAAADLLVEALEQIALSRPGGHWDGGWYRLDPERDLQNLRKIAHAALAAARPPLPEPDSTDQAGGTSDG